MIGPVITYFIGRYLLKPEIKALFDADKDDRPVTAQIRTAANDMVSSLRIIQVWHDLTLASAEKEYREKRAAIAAENEQQLAKSRASFSMLVRGLRDELSGIANES